MTVGMVQGHAINYIPVEVLQQVFHYLGPKDFNSARHVCSKWMASSLDSSLLTLMLKRGGFSIGPETRWQAVQTPQVMSTQTASSRPDVWLLSCRLARECSLASGWTGNGLRINRNNPLIECAHVDFSGLGDGPSLPDASHTGKLIFTASACGKFLLVADGGIIYVYELVGSDIRAWTSIICPRKVLAMSMDASSPPISVAALLEGRMGLVCSLSHGADHEPEASADANAIDRQRPKPTHPQDDDTTTPPSTKDYHPPAQPASFSDLEIQSATDLIRLHNCDDPAQHATNLIAQSWSPLRFAGSHRARRPTAPPAPSPRVLYRSVCRGDAPPRSVAVSAAGRCVAFGCADGADVHWGLRPAWRRWVPLAGPADAVHFAAGGGGALRLRASAAGPARRGEDGGVPPEYARGFAHVGALPLAGGRRALFVGGRDGRLGVGVEAPVGERARLRRRVVLVPPGEGRAPPAAYAAGAERGGALRVVAAYGGDVVLFSLPPGVLAVLEAEQRREGGLRRVEDEDGPSEEWLDWWPQEDFPTDRTAIEDAGGGPKSIWPLFLKGTTIGRLENVVEVAVNDSEELCIWAFTLDGSAVAWKIDNGSRNLVKSRAAPDGRILNQYELDADDDVIMKDLHDDHRFVDGHMMFPSTVILLANFVDVRYRVGYSTSGGEIVLPRALALENNEDVDMIQIHGTALFNDDGDIIMAGS